MEELKEALDADIQDRIMKEREMQSYIQEREREAAWKAELSRCEVTPFPFLCFSLFPIFLFTLRLSIPIITNSCLTIQKVLSFGNQVASFFAFILFYFYFYLFSLLFELM